jgi:hypothetical protein
VDGLADEESGIGNGIGGVAKEELEGGRVVGAEDWCEAVSVHDL